MAMVKCANTSLPPSLTWEKILRKEASTGKPEVNAGVMGTRSIPGEEDSHRKRGPVALGPGDSWTEPLPEDSQIRTWLTHYSPTHP